MKDGPEAIKESSNSSAGSSQNTQKRYVTKEIILYLTPSQIEALKAGKGLVSPQSLPKVAEQQHLRDQLSFREHDELIRQQFENIKAARIASSEKSQYFNADSDSQSQYNNQELVSVWSQNLPKIGEKQIFQYLYPNQKEINQRENQEKEQQTGGWLPIISVAERKAEEERLINEQLQQQWKSLLDQNKIQLKALSALSPKENSDEQSYQVPTEKPLLQLQYAPRHNDQKNAIEIEKLIRQRHRQELEKQSVLAQAETIANSPPILVHHEVKITKHRPVPVVKQVKIEVPTPVLVPVPEPYEVKVPHPYPVPLKVIKPIPVPVIQKEKELENSAPVEIEKRVPASIAKQFFVNVDRPYFVHNILPLEINKAVPIEISVDKAEKSSIFQQIWNS